MVDEDEEDLIKIIVDISMASEGAIKYGEMRDMPLEELFLIKSRVKEICDKREAEMQKVRNRG